jgi:hypothetical protein
MKLFIRAGLVLGLAASAACKESIAPKSLANPQQTTAQMNAFDTLFNVPILTSFSALSIEMGPQQVAQARIQALRTLAAATNPLRKQSALRPFAQGYETARMLRDLVPTMLDASAEDIFPPDVDGKTYEWNVDADVYLPTTRMGAPATGARFILYAVDVLTGLPNEPLVEVGFVDMIDQSTASVAKLRVLVVGTTTGSPVIYMNYTTTLEALSASSARIGTAGYVTNSATSPDTLRFTGNLNVSGSATSASVTQDVSFDVDSHDAHARLWERVTVTSSDANLRIFFLFKHGIEIVTLEGTFDADLIGQVLDGSITVKVDGGLFATCDVASTPTSYNLTCEGADADGLNAAEVEALDEIGEALAGMESVFAGVLNPAVNIFGGSN